MVLQFLEFSTIIIIHVALGFEFQRIRKNDTMLLVVDHQIGLFELVKDFEPIEYRNNVLAHAALGKVFNLPTILTTSTDDGAYIRFWVITHTNRTCQDQTGP